MRGWGVSRGEHALVVEKFERVVVRVPGREVGPDAVGKDGLEVEEGVVRGEDVLARAVEGACG